MKKRKKKKRHFFFSKLFSHLCVTSSSPCSFSSYSSYASSSLFLLCSSALCSSLLSDVLEEDVWTRDDRLSVFLEPWLRQKIDWWLIELRKNLTPRSDPVTLGVRRQRNQDACFIVSNKELGRIQHVRTPC